MKGWLVGTQEVAVQTGRGGMSQITQEPPSQLKERVVFLLNLYPYTCHYFALIINLCCRLDHFWKPPSFHINERAICAGQLKKLS